MISCSSSLIANFNDEYEQLGFKILKLKACQILIDRRNISYKKDHRIFCSISKLMYACDTDTEVVETICRISNTYFCSDYEMLLFHLGEL